MGSGNGWKYLRLEKATAAQGLAGRPLQVTRIAALKAKP